MKKRPLILTCTVAALAAAAWYGYQWWQNRLPLIDIPPGCPEPLYLERDTIDPFTAATDTTGYYGSRYLRLADFYDPQLKAARFLDREERGRLTGGDRAIWLNNDRIAVWRKGRFALLDADGTPLPLPTYDEIHFYAALRAEAPIPVRRGKYWGYIDASGREIVPPRYDKAGLFYDGIATIGKGGRYGYLAADGHEIVPPQYRAVGYHFFGNYGRVYFNIDDPVAAYYPDKRQEDGGFYAIIDRNGNAVASEPPGYDAMMGEEPPNSGYFEGRIADLYQYRDGDGNALPQH